MTHDQPSRDGTDEQTLQNHVCVVCVKQTGGTVLKTDIFNILLGYTYMLCSDK